ncbi:MAG: transglutaminase family protein [Novosphingobium sp.]
MLLNIRHTTRYDFSAPVDHGLQRLRLKPKSTHGQRVIDWNLELTGAKLQTEYADHHNNHTVLVSLDPGIQTLEISCSGSVETADNAGIFGHHSGHMPMWAFLRQTALTKPGPRMRALAAGLAADRGNSIDVLHELSRAVLGNVTYMTGQTDATTTAEQAVVAGHGVCQDHAHVFIGCARAMGIPARYVSGYLKMADRVDQDAGHGWAEAMVEGLGWVAFDVSNGISPDSGYVRVSSGCDYREAAPITGITFGPGDSALAVSVAVEQQTVEQ